MRTIYLVRHGRACEGDGRRRCIGATDIALDPSAREPSTVLGTWIRTQHDKQKFTLCSSTRSRARDTAEAMIAGLGDNLLGKLYLDSGFDEVHTGTWENRLFEDIKKEEKEEYEMRGKSLGYYRFPQGESIYEAGLRFGRALHDLLKRTPLDTHVIVVSHSGSIRAFLCKLLGMSPDDFMKIGSANLSMCILKEHDGKLLVEKTAYKPDLLLDEEEICRLYKRCQVPGQIVAHMKKTAEMVDQILDRIKDECPDIDRDLVKKAAYVHDIMRTQPMHALRGADLLRREGYYEIAALVEDHHSSCENQEGGLNEKDLLFYADKRVEEDRIVSLRERFDHSAGKCHTKEAKKTHDALYQRARRIEKIIIYR